MVEASVAEFRGANLANLNSFQIGCLNVSNRINFHIERPVGRDGVLEFQSTGYMLSFSLCLRKVTFSKA